MEGILLLVWVLSQDEVDEYEVEWGGGEILRWVGV